MLSMEFGKPNLLQPDLNEAHFLRLEKRWQKNSGSGRRNSCPSKINYNLFHTIDFLNV